MAIDFWAMRRPAAEIPVGGLFVLSGKTVQFGDALVGGTLFVAERKVSRRLSYREADECSYQWAELRPARAEDAEVYASCDGITKGAIVTRGQLEAFQRKVPAE